MISALWYARFMPLSLFNSFITISTQALVKNVYRKMILVNSVSSNEFSLAPYDHRHGLSLKVVVEIHIDVAIEKIITAGNLFNPCDSIYCPFCLSPPAQALFALLFLGLWDLFNKTMFFYRFTRIKFPGNWIDFSIYWTPGLLFFS